MADRTRRELSLVSLSLVAVALGVATGIGAAVFRVLIAFFHNLFFAGEISVAFDANRLTPPSPFGPWILLAPVLGGLVVVFIVRRFAPEAKGHGVPEVMDAIYYKGGVIRPVVVFAKALASAISIGSGHSVGREGPIIQIGSAIGSVFGQWGRLATWQVITLVAAGAGAGIAATFNTPLGGVMFAIELMLPEVSARTFLPVVLATGTATYVGRMAFGLAPAFTLSLAEVSNVALPTNPALLPLYVALGVICGLAAFAFVRGLHGLEDVMEARLPNPYLRAVAGFAVLGGLFLLLQPTTGAYHVDGVGYGTIEEVLHGRLDVAETLFLLFVAKLFATTLSLASGASGGVFAPSLFLGATLGGAFGSLAGMLFPELDLTAAQFALIGMAAMVGGGTGAAMTAILMMFEMTTAYSVIVPAIIAVACAIGTRRALSSENIYTFKLLRRGHRIPKDRHTNMFLVRPAREVMAPVKGRIAVSGRLDRADVTLRPLVMEGETGYALLVRGRHVSGVMRIEDWRRFAGARAGDAQGSGEPPQVMRRFILARPGDLMVDVIRRMNRHHAELVLVAEEGHSSVHADEILGVIGDHELAAEVRASFDDR
ncbi:MAG: transport integral membrane protein [Rhodothalassiaceae bacterium]|nr:MAG: transport integral membrane protein [Rhodothalassiaceae bacterium]